MPKDFVETVCPLNVALADLTSAELERLEGLLFCCGGPPERLTPALVARLLRS